MVINKSGYKIEFDGFVQNHQMELHLLQVQLHDELLYSSNFTKLTMDEFNEVANFCYDYIAKNKTLFKASSGNLDD